MNTLTYLKDLNEVLILLTSLKTLQSYPNQEESKICTHGLIGFFSSSAVLFLPVMIESERLGVEEAQKAQQRQILLGPGAAMAGQQHQQQQNAPLPPPPM